MVNDMGMYSINHPRRVPPVFADICLLVVSVWKAVKIRNTVQGSNWNDYPIIRTLIQDQAIYFIGSVSFNSHNDPNTYA